jgi:hypothetical protein
MGGWVSSSPHIVFRFGLFFDRDGFEGAFLDASPALCAQFGIDFCRVLDGYGIRRTYLSAGAASRAGFIVNFCRHYSDLLSYFGCE